jgi:hypothetical protein
VLDPSTFANSPRRSIVLRNREGGLKIIEVRKWTAMDNLQTSFPITPKRHERGSRQADRKSHLCRILFELVPLTLALVERT